MELKELIRECLEMNVQLEEYQSQLSKKRNYLKDEVLQTFVFDLRDYSNAVKILEDIEPSFLHSSEEKMIEIDATDVSIILEAHAHLFQEIQEKLTAIEEDSGQIRRQLSGLTGISELNRLMLVDNRKFQQAMKDYGPENRTAENTVKEKKGGILKRLFAK